MATLFLYTLATVLFSPLIFIFLGIRWVKGKEDHARFAERMGICKKPRPDGTLIWMHGASVGECLSMLPLVNKILSENPTAHVLVTSGTVTSAALMAKRLPERAFHQYIPVDFPWAAELFVKHWKPTAVLWFESEFWPNLLQSIYLARVPLFLLNGRISDKSFARWQKMPAFIRAVQSLFTLSFGQTKEDARRLQVLGAPEVASVGNIKYAAGQSPFDAEELLRLRNAIGVRPNFTMASTHANEEELGVAVYQKLRQNFVDPLLILVPRHPNRADDIESMCVKQGLVVARRSRNELPTREAHVYLADTIGEMGLLYQLSDLVFVGGTLIPFGGQNMLEPMRMGRVVFIGPHAFNFREIVAEAKADNALIEVANTDELSERIAFYLLHPTDGEALAARATALATSQMGVLDRVYAVLKERIGL